ncbi:unnamed protein product [Haemonchus placei]|uniref:Ricin B-type lectin domain-containing protein n=1 Tax=Haemonchus placei TaxID=6290 RepID=A0A0N4WVR9_HAEPC|nr:unnamed protein product [Haemonchus placei]
MKLLIWSMMLITGIKACMKTVPGEMPGDDPVCDNCASAAELTCEESNICDFSLLRRSKNGASCSTYSCSAGQMYAYIHRQSTPVDGAICDRDSQLVWKTTDGQAYGKTLQATCAFRCDKCTPAIPLSCPSGYTCDFDLLRETESAGSCMTYTCTDGQFLGDNGLLEGPVAVDSAVCRRDKIWMSPLGETFGTTLRATCAFQQCKKAVCVDGVMKANPGNVAVQLLSCNTMAQWMDSLGETFTAAQCEASES